MKLKRTKQCAKCPWKVSTKPSEIPNGYDRKKHEDLRDTISKPGLESFYSDPKVMACHESPIGKEQYCIGWLNHQLTIGNNLLLRMMMINCENINEIKTYGEQHTNFEDTIK